VGAAYTPSPIPCLFATRRTLRTVLIRPRLCGTVGFRVDRTSDLASVRRLLVSVPVAVVAQAAIVPRDEK